MKYYIKRKKFLQDCVHTIKVECQRDELKFKERLAFWEEQKEDWKIELKN